MSTSRKRRRGLGQTEDAPAKQYPTSRRGLLVPIHAPGAGLDPAQITSRPQDRACAMLKSGDVEGRHVLKGTCPVQLAFNKGKTYLRFCSGYQKEGRLIPVEAGEDAMRKARAICNSWYARTGHTESIQQPTAAKEKVHDLSRFQLIAEGMNASDELKHYALGTATRKKRAAGPWKPTSIYAAETRRLEFEAWTARQVKKSKKGGSR